MNILIIGNGFDLAHGLPTKYTDFLEFVKVIRQAVNIENSEDLDNIVWDKIHPKIRELIEINLKGTKRGLLFQKNGRDLVEDNYWIEYFLQCNMYKKENWIDFESEISDVIKSLNNDVNAYNFENDILHISNDFLKERLCDSQEVLTYRQLRDRLLNDLNKFIRAFEIYLTEYVEKIDIKVISPDIKEIVVDREIQDIQRVVLSRIISFNYSNTYERVYWDESYRKMGYYSLDYVHGKANIKNTIESNDMVLGIDEYLQDNRKNKDVRFIAFKKFYQRIYKQTGSLYKIWINRIREDYFEYLQKQIATEKYISNDTQTIKDRLTSYIITYKSHNNHQLYIFGHSLDITDRDVLRDLILNDNVYTTIFYLDKDVMGQQIANLVKVIGQDELIKRTGGSTKTIEFKQQQDMIPIEDNQSPCDQPKRKHAIFHAIKHKNPLKIGTFRMGPYVYLTERIIEIWKILFLKTL